jgi:hypothetical protein
MSANAESAGIEPKPNSSKRILRRVLYWATIFTLFLVVAGGLDDAWRKIESPHQHPETTFLDGFRDYVGGLIKQVGKLTPGQVRGTFIDRLESCHYDWSLKCQPIQPLLFDPCLDLPSELCAITTPTTTPDPLDATINCSGVPPERLLDCKKTYRANHPFSPRRRLTHSWLETMRGLPDATWVTAMMVRKAGWLATVIFGASSLFVIISLIAYLIAFIGLSMESRQVDVHALVIICWLLVGVPFLVSGVAWVVQLLMKAVIGFAYGLLSLIVLGIGFGSVLTAILEVKHLRSGLPSKG